MKHAYRGLLMLVMALAITACAAFQAPKTPQDAINQANILLTATAQQVAENVKVGTMTLAERDDAVVQLKKYATTVDEAQLLLRNGDAAGSQQKLALINAALLELNKRVAAKARKGT